MAKALRDWLNGERPPRHFHELSAWLPTDHESDGTFTWPVMTRGVEGV